MRKIAVMKCFGAYIGYDQYGDGGGAMHELIAQHVTEFTEVSDEDFEMLRRQFQTMSNSEHSFVIIEQQDDQNRLIQKTVADYKKVIKKREDARLLAEAKLQKEKKEREAKRLLKRQKSKKEQLEALASELGVKIEAKQ